MTLKSVNLRLQYAKFKQHFPKMDVKICLQHFRSNNPQFGYNHVLETKMESLNQNFDFGLFDNFDFYNAITWSLNKIVIAR